MKNVRIECPFYHSQNERRPVHDQGSTNSSLRKHASFNPNHRSDLLVKSEGNFQGAPCQNYNNYNGYAQQEPTYSMQPNYAQYGVNQNVYQQNANQDQYYNYPANFHNVSYPYQIMTQNVGYPSQGSPYAKMPYYSPQPNGGNLEGSGKVFTPSSENKLKMKSKMSTKSPHAIAGHKFGVGKTSSNQSSPAKNFSPGSASKTPPVNQHGADKAHGTFRNLCKDDANNYNNPQTSNYDSGKTVPQFNDKEASILRKST
jgi:hypothetical protein